MAKCDGKINVEILVNGKPLAETLSDDMFVTLYRNAITQFLADAGNTYYTLNDRAAAADAAGRLIQLGRDV